MRTKFFISAVFLSLVFFAGASFADAATNISSITTDHWAWNDIISWIDFYNTQSITVSSANLTGYASSSAGDISLDCHTTSGSPSDICSQSYYQVTNDGSGNLSGWGWNDEFGWISFDCHNNNGCGASPYEVLVDPTTGNFSNYAWNDVVGWISFNCVDPGLCGISNYKVNTAWAVTSTTATLDSSTFDTGVAAGAQLNSVLWHGNKPPGTSVYFQFAASNGAGGPWIYAGSDGTANTYYAIGPDQSVKLSYTPYNNKRYFRYRIFLQSNQSRTLSPRIDDIIINWSP